VARRLIIYAKEAVDDLAAIAAWQTQPGSGPRGRRRLQIIRAAIEQLRARPYLRPGGKWPGTREFVVMGYVVIYRIEAPDTGDSNTAGNVSIVRVFGPGQTRARP
jgi:plasmid stabilization system protein ParE